AWIGEPQVMLLDEPSNGLDNRAREILAQRIRLRGLEGLALFASHDAAFVEACGANILRMDHLKAPEHCLALEVDSSSIKNSLV
ncbi:MAG: ABC transporter ATP-binding protein, partial [Acidithiobacillus sp.]|nr:ABC transporter ATP-binding protein [Acidithiobacillus sp.]